MRPQNNEKVGMKQDMRMESDPISGSLGHLEKPPKLSEEGKLEADLASR